jgi:hypothetical protein
VESIGRTAPIGYALVHVRVQGYQQQLVTTAAG